MRVLDGEKGILLVEAEPGEALLADGQAALDLIATARHVHGCDRLVVYRKDLPAGFFDLRTGLAGEVLQKFVNYGARLAVVGDFGEVTSKSLRDFIRESNRTPKGAVCFVGTVEQATACLE